MDTKTQARVNIHAGELSGDNGLDAFIAGTIDLSANLYNYQQPHAFGVTLSIHCDDAASYRSLARACLKAAEHLDPTPVIVETPALDQVAA